MSAAQHGPNHQFVIEGFEALLLARVTQLSPLARRLLLMVGDGLLLPSAVVLSFWLRLDDPFAKEWHPALSWMVLAAPLVGVLLFWLTGQYKGLTRYVGSRSFYQLALGNGLLMLFLLAFGEFFRLPSPPRSCWLLFWLCATGLCGLMRFSLRDLLWRLSLRGQVDRKSIVIYGAGAAGIQLFSSLSHSDAHRTIGFIDDDATLWGRTIKGIPIASPDSLLTTGSRPDLVLLAIPSLSKRDRKRIVSRVQKSGCSILAVPAIDALTSGQAQIDALQPVSIEDLLGRDVVAPQQELLTQPFEGKVVCVTGAGGSIGSELCRQILRLQPRKLLLLERSEPALYSIHQELQACLQDEINLIPLLGSARDFDLVRSLFVHEQVQVVLHAAAYKHVPLVEANPLSGLANNVGSTRVICDAALAAGVDQVVLISTDKAVRPTNVMGASKRLAELVVQASADRPGQTCFSMVRFGNVLDSSGSVVPLFRRQIAAGGPITLTHPEVVRYFMTIPEAAQLVLQAAGLAQGGDVFLLDMGEPVKIRELAEQMIQLSGLQLKDHNHPNGDIEIICTGLRPGEKLYEELLIDADADPTVHPLIFCARERSLPAGELFPLLDKLELLQKQQDLSQALILLHQLVPEWVSQRSLPSDRNLQPQRGDQVMKR